MVDKHSFLEGEYQIRVYRLKESSSWQVILATLIVASLIGVPVLIVIHAVWWVFVILSGFLFSIALLARWPISNKLTLKMKSEGIYLVGNGKQETFIQWKAIARILPEEPPIREDDPTHLIGFITIYLKESSRKILLYPQV